MSFKATMIADSISNEGIRLSTMLLRYPRFIHAEFMTHRDFSRSASSSRAIPNARLIADMRSDPAMPIFWGVNQGGMQANAELSSELIHTAKTLWLDGMEKAIQTAEALNKVGLHKQIANRVLEPWTHINVVVTSTRWNNWFALRDHPAAQPEIQELARKMKAALAGSTPKLLMHGQWHVPFTSYEEAYEFSQGATSDIGVWKIAARVSAARCARTSYLTHDGKVSTVTEDEDLYMRLVGGEPLHASPTEHQATPDYRAKFTHWMNPGLHGNFDGWMQHRKMLPGERVFG